MNITLFGFCSSDHNKFDEEFYSQKQKKIFVTLPNSEQEKIKKIWGNLKPPIYDGRIIIHISKKNNISGILDTWCNYSVRTQNYSTGTYSNKKLLLQSLI